MAEEYDGLPLNTPTLIRTEGQIEIWATRTSNGGTVERRPTGSLAVLEGNRDAINSRLEAVLVDNQTFLAIATPTAGQTAAQVRKLTRQVNALLRVALSDFSSDTDT